MAARKLQPKTASKDTQEDLFDSLKGMFSLGVQEFSKSIDAVFAAPKYGKNQISRELAKQEKILQRSRT